MVKAAGSAWLLIGKDDFLKKETLSELRKKNLPAASDASDYQEFSASSQPARTALDFVRTAPFLSPKRMAVLFEVEELEDDDRDALVAALEGLPSWAALVLVAGEGDVRKDAFLKKLAEGAEMVSCRPPYDNEMPAWLDARAKKAGVQLERGAVRVLLERSGKDLAGMCQSIEQLAVFVSPRKRVEEKDAEQLVGRSLQTDVFKLVDAVLDKKPALALAMASSLLSEGTRPFEIVAVLAGQVERLRRGAALVERGASPAEIGRELKVHPYFVDKFVRQAEQARGGKATKLAASLLECDEAIKTGRLGERLAFEKAILELCA